MSKKNDAARWTPVGAVFEGERILIHGLDPWQHPWVGTEATVALFHPSYPDQREMMTVYRIETPNGPVVFAAGELSAGVWGFFVPADSAGRAITLY
jgi:hypothetical protein